jgi:ABC-type phosphate/phosphonate transport system substrate-binding protein
MKNILILTSLIGLMCLSLAGHADNTAAASPSSQSNITANSKPVCKAGMAPKIVKSKWQCVQKDLKANSNPQDRETDRRVEMNIIFD